MLARTDCPPHSIHCSLSRSHHSGLSFAANSLPFCTFSLLTTPQTTSVSRDVNVCMCLCKAKRSVYSRSGHAVRCAQSVGVVVSALETTCIPRSLLSLVRALRVWVGALLLLPHSSPSPRGGRTTSDESTFGYLGSPDAQSASAVCAGALKSHLLAVQPVHQQHQEKDSQFFRLSAAAKASSVSF